jgi:hypothetical protein
LNAVNSYLNGSAKQAVQQQQQQQQIQASSFNLYNLPTSESPFQQSAPKPAPSSSSNVNKESTEVIFEQLEKLGKLREIGVLTEEEFAEQKKKLLERL